VVTHVNMGGGVPTAAGPGPAGPPCRRVCRLPVPPSPTRSMAGSWPGAARGISERPASEPNGPVYCRLGGSRRRGRRF